MHQAV